MVDKDVYKLQYIYGNYTSKMIINFKNGQKLNIHRMDNEGLQQIKEWLSSNEEKSNFYSFLHDDRLYYISRDSIAHVEIDFTYFQSPPR